MNKRLRKKLRKKHMEEFEREVNMVNQLTFILQNSVYDILGNYKPNMSIFLKNRKSFKSNVIKSLQEIYNKEE